MISIIFFIINFICTYILSDNRLRELGYYFSFLSLYIKMKNNFYYLSLITNYCLSNLFYLLKYAQMTKPFTNKLELARSGNSCLQQIFLLNLTLNLTLRFGCKCKLVRKIVQIKSLCI